jgi:ankyrin repeat protein
LDITKTLLFFTFFFNLQKKIFADEATVRGETPLHLAARANQTDIIRILLRNGAQVDARARVCIV